ncbi:Outer membrane protein YfgL, lipoprotein component of the protein assembly complex (forms a complex with YaeT, YfiO, and NlpB) [uncultured Candidatus Thioglobus sp.]|nr:Outer membrane protein YfgL, lipoprotein component of the protein assembly complex (forms a complex with YaeT, YfiO, and NlpB) [uncultured Candidatus Thioglobus sp.]
MRFSYYSFLLSCLCVVISGCTVTNSLKNVFNKKSENSIEAPLITPLQDIEARIKIIKIWSKNIGKGFQDESLKLHPAYISGQIFVADLSGDLLGIDANTGNNIWKHHTDLTITGGPGVSQKLIVIGSEDGDIFAYSRENGELVWTSKVSSEVLSVPQINDSFVVVRAGDGKLFCLNAENGKHVWIHDVPVPALTLRGTSSPTIVGDIVIAGFDDGRLVAIELNTGKVVWETNVSLASGRSQLERIIDIDSDPIVAGKDVYASTFQGHFATIALESGNIVWTRDIFSHVGFVVDEENIYITDEKSYVWCIERLTGTVVWQQKDLSGRMVTKSTIIGNFVVVGDTEGYLHWIDKNDGQFIARKKISKNAILVPPIATPDILYTYSSDGTLSAYTYH